MYQDLKRWCAARDSDDDWQILIRQIASSLDPASGRSDTQPVGKYMVKLDELCAELPRIIGESAEKGCNTYFGVCPRIGPEPDCHRKGGIRIVPALWADVDNCP